MNTPPLTLRLQIDEDPLQLDAGRWDALLAQSAQPTPFMRLAFLRALQRSGSACAATGWEARFLSVWDGDQLMGACPAYLKSHSWGEYVFDWAWAEAYHRHGLHYYPKLLVAVPFTPVPGSRLLARTPAARQALIDGLRQLALREQASSAHVLFGDDSDQAALCAAGWLPRQQVQFHWQGNGQPCSFADFLASLQREKRKKIQQEQRRVREAGVSFRAPRGSDISSADWDFFYRCYQLTYRAHHSKPYLSRDFFAQMQAEMPEHWLMFIAEREGQPVAASLLALDPARRSAFGRYWGATEAIPCLHFDACYYQPLAWCLAQGWLRFEGGAQGEHKMARGLLPVGTQSAHWLAHPQFRDAVADFLAQEGQAMQNYVNELEQHQPFKPASTSKT
ncbi:GNAT family N-acetyltransferase [Paucibacter sp. APW11]|uniref:GNAT family N-acetyltransferase n=1 Tax=Roseateles aquae TaxID=3077235 RepID=A0ABU3P7K8_9BURK|nr:GNAT family N-acetyltransferase [Paucibacter sp. APW11]MDT8998567.1 GNAT family N-acetyltransferase [Paucibacter sp. APW11]